MAIRREEVERIAELARLELAPEHAERMTRELSAVLDFVATLDRLDLAGCEPVTLAPEGAPLREDVPDDRRLDAERATAGAPAAEHGFFLVPPIVENLEP
jgi:aspartyl-tRNA(Asn)/glutamyl-tRNA(Gln) amidotransferase subunit C